MNDHELLELAAKAVGLAKGKAQDSQWFYCDQGQCGEGFYLVDGNLLSYWNPLTDDGDALRLAVHIGMIVDVRYGELMKEMQCHNRITYWVTPSNGMTVDCDNPVSDNLASIRRAIVRAAAEIGKEMEKNHD